MNKDVLRYLDKVVELIIKNDLRFDVIVDTNRFVVEPYYVTRLFQSSFCNPNAFYAPINWVGIRTYIMRKYAVMVNSELEYIRYQLRDYTQRKIDNGEVYTQNDKVVL